MSGSLQDALATFAKVEANLDKLAAVWTQIRALVPDGPVWGLDTPEWRALRLAYGDLCAGLPPIDGFRIDPNAVMAPDEIAQTRLDFMEIGEPGPFHVETLLEQPGEMIDDFRVRLTRARRRLVVGEIRTAVDRIDTILATATVTVTTSERHGAWSGEPRWDELASVFRELEHLVGALTPRRARWGDFSRHLHFAEETDLVDIVRLDWPSVRAELEPVIFTDREPLPVDTDVDLGTLVPPTPGLPSVGLRPLQWGVLDDELFERLVFELLRRQPGYSDVTWLMPTRAPDRGRDIQAYLTVTDPLLPTRRQRLIIQCKHWQSRSVNLDEITKLLGQTLLWEPPKVEMLVIATSGRFTQDAVAYVERREEQRELPRVVMLADSDLEVLLSGQQGLIAQFGLR